MPSPRGPSPRAVAHVWALAVAGACGVLLAKYRLVGSAVPPFAVVAAGLAALGGAVALVAWRVRAPARPAVAAFAAVAVLALATVPLSPWPYEMEGAARRLPHPDGWESRWFSSGGGPLAWSAPWSRGYAAYEYAPDADVAALTGALADALEADGWSVEAARVEEERARHGPDLATIPETPVPVGRVWATRGGLAAEGTVGRWTPTCCQLSTDPTVPIRTFVTVQEIAHASRAPSAA